MLGADELLQRRYKITRQLGQGGMGAVYEAEDAKQFGKIVALKEILTTLTNASDARQHELFRSAFEREAKILMQVDHEAFPQVIDYFSEGNRQFLVMQLIQGKDLNELLHKRQSAFPLEQVCDWADQLLDALDYLHTLKPPIIHRDIKPQNLKLTERGKIKLLDFGIAKGIDKKASVTITNATMVAATLHYSPSEQLLRVIDPITREALQMIYGEKMERVLEQNADLRSDIYSLAATLYHFLTNKAPVDSLKRMIEFWREKPDNLISPHKLNPEIPPEISDWILKAMQINREERFSSALEMRNALKNAVGGKSRREEEILRQSWAREQEKLRIEREKLQLERQKIERERLEHQQEIERQRRRALEQQNSHDAATLTDLPPEYPITSNPSNLELTQPSFISHSTPSSAKTLRSDKIPATEGNAAHEETGVSFFADSEISKEEVSENTTAHGATEFLYFDESKFGTENKSAEFVPQPARTQETSPAATVAISSENVKWLIPLAALALIFISGIVGGMWYFLGSSSSKSESKDSSANTSETNSIKSSTIIEPVASPKVDDEPANVGKTPTQKTDSAAPPTAPSKPTAETKDVPQPKTETPPVQAKTPSPKKDIPKPPAKKKKNMDCIFTDDCK